MFKCFLFFFTLISATTFAQDHGLRNFKTVMSGALYRGGNSGGGQVPMKQSSLQGLCNAGFSGAVYLYPTSRSQTQVLSCSGNRITYHPIAMKKDKQILSLIYEAIQGGKGPFYVHCWNGVHASGYIATVALMQFCGYSSSQALSYWNSHVPPRIRYSHVQAKIRRFQPSGNLRLSSSEASQFCRGIEQGPY